MAFFSNGNFSASANGIFIFNNNGTVRDHFADNRIADGNKNWGKLITTNSEATRDKRGRPYILITVNAGNLTVFRTSTDRDRAVEHARQAVRSITGDERELFFRNTVDTEEEQIWEVIARKEIAA